MACNENNINIKESAPSSGAACQLSIQLLPYALKTPVILGTVEHWTGFNNGNPALSRPIVIGEHYAVTGTTYTALLKTNPNPFIAPFANNGVTLSNIISFSLGLTPSCEIGSYSASDIKIPDPINLAIEHTKSKANDAYLNTRFGCGSLKPIKIEHGHSLSINKNNTDITVWRECYEKRLCVTLGISSPLLNMRDKPANHGHIAASQLTTCIKTGHEHFVRATLYEPIHNVCAQSVTYSGANLYIDTGILQGQTNLCANVVKLNKGFNVSSDLSITYGLTIKHAGTHAAVIELTIDPKFKILMTAGLNSNTTFVPTDYPMIANFETGSSASSVLSVIHANAAIGHASSTMLSFAPRVFDRCFSDINYISIEQLTGAMSETDIELTRFARPVVAPKIIVAEEGEIVRVEF